MSSTVAEQSTGGSPPLLDHLFFSQATDARDRVSAISLAAALLLHALLLALAISPVGRHLLKPETDPGVGTGIGAGAAGGGGGGSDEQVAIVSLQAPPSPAAAAEVQIEVPPPPPPALDMPVIEPPKPPQLAMNTVQNVAPPAVSANGGYGTGTGGGSGPGTGPGSGGGSGGGEGGGIGSGVGPGIGRGRLLQPVPEFVLLPPMPAPAVARGKTVTVRVAIDATGAVRDVELLPSSGDRNFDQALRRTAMGWHFRPARDAANRAVATTGEFSFTF